MDTIRIRGARTHNLKNIDLDIPRDQLIVITGLSGSGKSSLAFDTIYAEGQRRYVESLSTYARQFLSIMEKPDVDHIEGLSPAISIEQKSTSHNPRSTVGTITEIYDYLRLLFARAGIPRCPKHHTSLEAQTVSQMVDQIMALKPGSRWMLLAPVINDRKGEHIQILNELLNQGFIRARINGEVYELDDPPDLDLRKKHTIEAIVDRFRIREDIGIRLSESLETSLGLANGIALAVSMDEPQHVITFSERYACPQCGYSLTELEPRIFSFNNPKGACSDCDGLGVIEFFDPNLVVHDRNLSLAGGAVRGWDRRNSYYYQLICSLAEHYGFDPEEPFYSLAESTQNVVLHGSKREAITFKMLTSRGTVRKRRHTFEGILPNMERRFRETDSSMVREELAKYLSGKSCPECQGARLNVAARNVFIAEHALHELTRLSNRRLLDFFTHVDLPGKRGQVAVKIVHEIVTRLEFLVNVGLDYLTLDRSADSLSGGEAQRIRLASQIGAGLVGVMYVLDEPSIGLHQRDNQRLLKTLLQLRDLGNTVIVVEHDEDSIRTAQHVIDIGPGAGVHGGRVVAQGTPADITAHTGSLTGKYLSGRLQISVPEERVAPKPGQQLRLRRASGNNLKDLDVSFPVGLFTCITGVSGSGKSTLVNDTLYRYAARELNNASVQPAQCKSVEGLDLINKVVDINQSPIGRTPRSNPATYTGLFTPIRELFAATPEARSRGYTPGRFSFNVKGGRCEACKGDGLIKVEMHFLPDIFVNCDICNSQRYNRETLEIRYKGKDIHEVLEMTVEEAREFFSAIPVLARKLQTLIDVGLGYISLGQNAVTLSGGEAQRVKLGRELSRRDTGDTLYILDEPTTGLHFHDIQQLLHVLHRFRNHGNTVLVIEHNLDVVKTADWIIDLGPEGGEGGGQIIAQGTPEAIAENPNSHTGRFLKPLISRTLAVGK
ncbi:MAG: excinuclease ABC subunit UvrA [Pseudomonadota bacterium]|nr:excinuclease ABC subunit UvrA [Pseudomonadota bacterium]